MQISLSYGLYVICFLSSSTNQALIRNWIHQKKSLLVLSQLIPVSRELTRLALQFPWNWLVLWFCSDTCIRSCSTIRTGSFRFCIHGGSAQERRCSKARSITISLEVPQLTMEPPTSLISVCSCKAYQESTTPAKFRVDGNQGENDSSAHQLGRFVYHNFLETL